MRCIGVAVLLMTVALHAAYTNGLAQEREPAQADTSSASDIYNPPRVITPDYEAGSQPEAEAGHETPSSGEPSARTAEDEDKRQGRCPSCGGWSRARVGAGADLTTGWLFADLSDINQQVSMMGIPEVSDEVFIAGGRGYARIGHLLIGGAAYAGDTESGGIPDCCARSARVEIGYGGVLIGFATIRPRYEIMTGMVFGGGSVTIVRERNSRSMSNWNEAWRDFYETGPDSLATEDLNITSKIVGEFIALEPFASLKYWIMPFMALDVSGSYLRAEIGKGEWELDGVTIPDSPESNIGGWTLKLGFHFGL